MKRIVVNGGKPLQGNLPVSGSKNAALPVIFACILTRGVSRIDNLPDIGDVRVALDILSSFGAVVTKIGGSYYIDTHSLTYSDPDPLLVERIRASTYLIGSCLARFNRCPIMKFGGCNFSLRPIDMHIDACRRLGAYSEDNVLKITHPRGCEIIFHKASVGATVNALLLASVAEGDSIIRGCAVEPHIDLLIRFLNSAGADIRRQGRDLYISGRELHGGRVTVIPDMIEAGSYLGISLMCGGHVCVSGCPMDDMTSVLLAFNRLGADLSQDASGRASVALKEHHALSLVAEPYPGFPTDLQPIFAPIMASLDGGDITDRVWQGRFGYLNSLSDFGVISHLRDDMAYIYPSRLHNGVSCAPDLRGGMAGLMCALYSKGRSEILSAETILRGYENLEEKLCAIGADIKIEDI